MPTPLTPLEKEVLKLKISQLTMDRAFVSEKARSDFQQLILQKALFTENGYFGPAAQPLSRYIETEYEDRRGQLAPLHPAAKSAPAEADSAGPTVDLNDIQPGASREVLDNAWKAIQNAWTGTMEPYGPKGVR